MLVLSRKLSEIVRIQVPASAVPQEILIKVIEIRSDKIRLGFEADPVIQIHRDEIIERIKRDGPIQKPAKPPVRPIIRLGDRLPGEQ